MQSSLVSGNDSASESPVKLGHTCPRGFPADGRAVLLVAVILVLPPPFSQADRKWATGF